jgi:hypothetical protein
MATLRLGTSKVTVITSVGACAQVRVQAAEHRTRYYLVYE